MDTIEWNRSELKVYEDQLNIFLKKVKFPDIRTVCISGWDGTNLVEDHGDFAPNLLKVILDSKKRDVDKLVKINPLRVKCQLVFLDGNYGLVTSGFKSILHNMNNYYDSEVEEIEGKVIHKKRKSGIVYLSIKTDQSALDFIRNIVLRSDDTTIAIGMIMV